MGTCVKPDDCMQVLKLVMCVLYQIEVLIASHMSISVHSDVTVLTYLTYYEGNRYKL